MNNAINPNLINNLMASNAMPNLQLTQIDGFDPVPEFVDSSGQRWQLIKSASSGMGEIPDPHSINIVDYWNHAHPDSNGKIFIYVVEGVRVPKTNRETACRVLYCWFSTIDNKNFTPQMIRPEEWLTANVYASAITDARVSKLKALCKVKDEAPQASPIPQTNGGGGSYQQAPLINMEMLQHDARPDRETRPINTDNQRERGKNNKS